jgi:hypothetical protein
VALFVGLNSFILPGDYRLKNREINASPMEACVLKVHLEVGMLPEG